jgi:hypothetical protein
MEVKKLDKQSAAVFTNLLKEESYAHFEARSVLLGKKGTGKTTVTRTTHGDETVVLPVPFLPSNTERASKWA